MQPVGISFVVRTAANPSAVVGGMRQVFAAADPEMAIEPATTMKQIVEKSVAARRFEMYLAVTFAVAALLLASLGIYGVISFAVARRTPEIGIRIALGAQRRQLMALVLRQGMRPVVLGIVAGFSGALMMGRWMSSQLYEVAPADPVAIGGVTV